MSLAVGTRLGSYEIVASIGAGAMGEVYRARDLKLGREVALKVLLPQFASDRERLRRFEQEARAASALNHPNIVHIYDIGQEHDTHFMVMELVEGMTLRNVLAGAPLDIETVLELGRQMAAGLANAHEAGIVHRDLKPENMMVTDDGFAKILDFGLAKLLDVPFESHSEMATMARLGTRHGMLIGTVEYMSPEQAAGKAVDHRSDQFSLGLILYEMATGALAFRRETAAQTLASIIESQPRPMRELNTECPSDLTDVVKRCLEKEPAGRYAETSDLVQALKSVSIDVAPPPVIPPVPQNPEPDVPPLGKGLQSLMDGVDDEIKIVIGDVDDALAEIGGARYQIQGDEGGAVKVISERRLRKKLRKNRYSGTELVRREGDAEWQPLFESDLFRQEVPYRGDPGTWAQRRRLMSFLEHAAVYVTFGVAWFVFRGEVPTWMGFWGIGLAVHAVNTVPALIPLFGRRALKEPVASPTSEALPTSTEARKALEDGLLSASFRAEVARVKELLAKRGDKASGSLVGEVDAIVAKMVDVATKKRDLAEQTSAEERARLGETVEEAERKLIEADAANDRRLYQKQFDVLRQRQTAIEKALAVVERLTIKQDVAEHQIKQLRLDLSRANASSSSVPELTSRLQDIRHEVDATEQVDEAIAQELLS